MVDQRQHNSSNLGMSVSEVQRSLSTDSGQQLSGLKLGIVEDTRDPLGKHRARVRVPMVHRAPEDNPTERLPWAEQLWTFGGFYGGGAALPLVVGARVWVEFRDGAADQPIIVGASPALPYEPQLYGQKRTELNSADEADSSQGVWKGEEVRITLPDGTEVVRSKSEVPEEARDPFLHEPTTFIPIKTPKGAALIMEERDGEEYTDLLDRAGQGLHMSAPITRERNRYNGAARGLRSVSRGDQLDYAKDTVNREAELSLRDLAQQGLTLEARAQEERALLVSRRLRSNKTHENPTDAGDVQVLDLSAGANRTLILGKVSGRVRFSITCDANRGIIELASDLSIRLRTKRVFVQAQRTVLESDVTVDGNLTVTGQTVLFGDSTVTSGGGGGSSGGQSGAAAATEAAAALVATLAPVATSGSYASLADKPAPFDPFDEHVALSTMYLSGW